MLPCYHWLVTSTTRIPESQTPRPPQCAAVLPCIQSSTAQVGVHSRIATISASLHPSLSDAFPAQDKKDSPSHQDFEPHSCNIHVKHLQDGPAVDQLFRSLHSKHAIWQQTCFPARPSHSGTKVLGSPAAKVTRSSDTNRGREKGSTPTHPPDGLETTLQASCSVKVSGFIETLRWGPCTHMTQVLWPVSPITWAPSKPNKKHTSNYFKPYNILNFQQNPNPIQQKIDLR